METVIETVDHPIVVMFRRRAEVLEARHAQRRNPEESIARLAIWISLTMS
ncbi:hypothetical protein G7047_29670 (plasmid) [Diaphorobacter sp. HDW4A]|nr:hypothetical protein [Diaphorobacter sp. HDW4A]QIL84209.1 hypothetical protein G7047_29670 [Diaphorobacter sp. HDW4A]